MPLRQDRIIPLVVASALFMENLDSTVIATSLPAIALDLRQDPVILKLAFTSYLLSLAVFIPISGWCADRFGARRVFRVAIGIFTLASVGCGFAQSLEGLVAARAFQGLGGALMVPVGRLIVLRLVPKRELLNALAYLTIPALVGPLAGPPLGGFITTYFHWRWIFWINIPVGILGIFLATRFIPKLQAETPDRFDFAGFVLVGAGLSTLMFGVTTLSADILPPHGAPLLIGVGLSSSSSTFSTPAASPMPSLISPSCASRRSGRASWAAASSASASVRCPSYCRSSCSSGSGSIPSSRGC